MLVYRLSFQIILGVLLAVRAGKCLRRLVRLEAHISLLKLGGSRGIPHARIAKHQVIVSLKIFRIYLQSLVELIPRGRVVMLQK